MKVNVDNCTTLVAADLIRLLGGNTNDLHTFAIRSADGTNFLIRSFARIEGLSRDQVIARNLFEDRRLEIFFQPDLVRAIRYEQGNPLEISIKPILRLLRLSNVIEDEPRLFQAHGELCFQDEDGNQVFASIAVTEATFDPATNEFTVVVGRFDAHPLLVPDAWRGDVVNTLAQEQ